MDFFGDVGCMTSTCWLEFGDDTDHGADEKILKEFLPL